MAVSGGDAPRVAVVGTGFGARIHVPALRAAGFDVVTLVGTDAERTARRAGRVGVPGASTDLPSVLAEVDAITVATPPATQKTGCDGIQGIARPNAVNARPQPR